MTKNELARVLELVDDFRRSGETRARFARRRRLHPSAFSRILHVSELPPELLAELAALPRLSRTHIEVIATAAPERRADVLAAIKKGRSTYKLRDRRETTAVALEPAPALAPTPSQQIAPKIAPHVAPAQLEQVSRSLAATPDETLAFASELLLVLWRSGRERVEESFRAFRAARAG